MNGFEILSCDRYLCIMPTFQCTAECTHCGTISSPREDTWLPEEQMSNAIDQAAAAGYKGIVFTGGEPTLAGEKLLTAMRRAALQGLWVRIVTNAHWAASEGAAVACVDRFVAAGLSEINLSTGDQHARFVPLENIFHAARAAAAACVDTVILVETLRERSVTRESIETHPAFRSIVKDFADAPVTLIESPWSPLSPSRVQKYPDGMALNKSNLCGTSGCESIFRSPTIQPDGTISPCCGLGIRFVAELQIGDIRDMTLAEAEKAAADDLLKQWIGRDGPERILAWAASIDPSIEWENMYAHRCQACIRLFRDPKVRGIVDKHGPELPAKGQNRQRPDTFKSKV